MPQNKKVMWTVVVIVIVVLGVLFFGKSSTPEKLSDTTGESADTDTTVPKATAAKTNSTKTSTGINPAPSGVVVVAPKTLRQLIASNQSLKCTFTDTSGVTGVEGTVYISGNKTRADLSVSFNTTSKAHEIIIGEKTYVWTDTSNTGTESTLAMSGSPTATPTKDGISADKKLDYRCDKWAMDSSKLVLPPNITFKAQ